MIWGGSHQKEKRERMINPKPPLFFCGGLCPLDKSSPALRAVQRALPALHPPYALRLRLLQG